MKITQDVRDYAATLNDPALAATSPEAVAKAGMAQMSDKFNAMGQQVYVDAEKVKESNKAL
jgi:phosphomethylpyrimidine synthase